MLRATWLTWPDAFIDVSRELYLPWRVACGDLLYRDLAYDFGPCSVYLNAALFSLLGRPSVHALFALNFAFWIAVLLALHALLRRLARPAVAALAFSLFILLFSFNRYLGVGNYNFLAPYSHELPRGFLFALLSLLSLDSAFRRRSRLLFFLSGALLGLALFTKPEIALAAVPASWVLFLARFPRRRGRPARDGNQEAPPPSLPPRHFSLFALPFSLHAVGAFCAVVMVLAPLAIALGSFSQALHDGLLKLYLDCFNPALASLPFYKKVLGADAIHEHALRRLLGGVLAAAPLLFARFALPRLSYRPLRLAATTLLALAAAAIGFSAFVPLNAALPLAPVMFALATFRDRGDAASCRVLPERGRPAREGGSGTPAPALFHRLFSLFVFRCSLHAENASRAVRMAPLALAFAAFSFLLSSKILLDAHIWHYGFVLALPSFCCAVLLAFRPPCPSSRAAVAAALLFGFSAAALRMHLSSVRAWDIARPVMDDAFLAPRV